MKLICNVKEELKPVALQAAKESGLNVIIQDVAYIPNSTQVPEGYISIFAPEGKDTTSFWEQYDRIQQEQASAA